MDEELLNIIFELQGTLPRQGPGNDASTLKALSYCSKLTDTPRILDIGCGPGAQTLALAQALPKAAILATDIHLPYLEQLEESTGSLDNIQTQVADMKALPFMPSSFDLIWSEGAAYIMGIKAALEAWHPLLKPGGYLAFTELVWLTETPPNEVAEFFGEEYPAMTYPEIINARIKKAGYNPLAHFTLPDSAWWDKYYTPLAAQLPEFERKYAGNNLALSVIAMMRKEQEIRRRFPSSYGYEFFIAQKTD